MAWQQKKLRDYTSRKGIHLSGYSPLSAPGKSYGGSSLQHRVVKDVAEKRGKTPAQVCSTTYSSSISCGPKQALLFAKPMTFVCLQISGSLEMGREHWLFCFTSKQQCRQA